MNFQMGGNIMVSKRKNREMEKWRKEKGFSIWYIPVQKEVK